MIPNINEMLEPHRFTINGKMWLVEEEPVKVLLQEYGKAILDHLMLHADQYIYVIDEPDEPTEAVFTYDKMDELKRSLK